MIYVYIYIYVFKVYIWLVVSTYPTEKYDAVSWDDENVPICGKTIRSCSKPPTRYISYMYIIHYLKQRYMIINKPIHLEGS